MATWEDYSFIKKTFPEFDLIGQGPCAAGGNGMILKVGAKCKCKKKSREQRDTYKWGSTSEHACSNSVRDSEARVAKVHVST